MVTRVVNDRRRIKVYSMIMEKVNNRHFGNVASVPNSAVVTKDFLVEKSGDTTQTSSEMTRVSSRLKGRNLPERKSNDIQNSS